MAPSRRVFVLSAAGLPLAGCSSILPIGGPAPDVYSLWPKKTFDPNLPRTDWQLVIEEPLASGALDNNKIAIRPSDFELKFYPNARWTERAPKMVQALLIESFENTGKMVAVGRQAVGLRGDYVLKTELRELEFDMFRGEEPVARVRLNAKLVRQPAALIVASSSFQSSMQVDEVKLPEALDGLNEAMNKVLRQVVEWTILAGAADRARQNKG